MNASRRLQPAVELAQQHADDAARNVAVCQQTVKDRKLQLDELVGYRVDYTNGLREKSQAGFSSARMNDYSVFMERLNTAIDQLQSTLESAYQELSTSKRTFFEKLQRAKALESAMLRHQQSERQVQSRREQNESDEHAQRLVRRGFS